MLLRLRYNRKYKKFILPSVNIAKPLIVNNNSTNLSHFKKIVIFEITIKLKLPSTMLSFNRFIKHFKKPFLQKFIIFVLTILPSTGNGKDNIRDFIIRHYSIEQGLSQSSVFSIYQDSKGYIWFGTRGGGLNRFNGYTFDTFRSNHYDTTSLSCNEIVAVYEDSRKNLWIGTKFGGANLYHADKESFTRLSLIEGGVNNFAVNCFLEGVNNDLWIGSDIGLFRFNHSDQSFEITKISGKEITEITSMIRNNTGEIIIGSRKGVYQFSPSDSLSVLLAPVKSNSSDQLEQSKIPLLLDSSENLWFGTPQGVYQIPAHNKEIIVENPLNLDILNSKPIRTINEDKDGNIWFGIKGGLLRFNPTRSSDVFFDQQKDPSYSLSHNSVHSFFEDNQGNIWVGTWGGGVTFISQVSRRFTHFQSVPFQNSLSDNTVSAFAEDENGLWIGTENGGLNYYNFHHDQFTIYDKTQRLGLTSNHIKCLHTDNENNLWIGTWGNGIFLLDKNTGKFSNYLPSSTVYSIARDTDNHLWIGTMNGLFRFNPVTRSAINYYELSTNSSNPEASFVTYLYFDLAGNLWAGTKGQGLFLYNRLTDNFVGYTNIPGDSTSLINNYVICINEGKNGDLWIGTNTGLCRYHYDTNAFSELDKRITLPDNVINGIVADYENRIWVATNKGISRIDPKTLEIGNFDIRDGLQSNEFTRAAYFKTSHGLICFGGINGFNTFNPENIHINTYAPEIIFTNLRIFNQNVIPGDHHNVLSQHISKTSKIVLTYNQSLFELEFVAFNYFMPFRTRYKYKLENYNDEWIDLQTDRKVSFMNLRQGNYLLHITASNEDDVWNETPISMEIVILPPIWLTNWAFLAYGLILIAFIFLLRNIISTRYRQKNQILNEKLEKQRLEELNQMKLRFFTNITHEFKTPLTLISAPLESLMAENSIDKRKYYYHLIKNNTERLKRLVEQLMDFRKAEHDKIKIRVKPINLKIFIEEITESFSDFAIRKNVNFQVSCKIDTQASHWFDPNIIDKIIFNLLSNSFKFTSAKGNIILNVLVENDNAVIIVNDTGKGISQDKLPQIFDRFCNIENPENTYISGTGIGLSFSKRLAEIHKGTLDATSEQGVGSEFTLRFPINPESYAETEIAPLKPVKEDQTTPEPIANTIEPEYIGETLPFHSKDDNYSILIAEDDNELLHYLKNHFTQFYTIYVAENGSQAQEIALRKMPDLIITDLMMPEMDGMQLCEAIKNEFMTSHIPIILLTAKTDPEFRTEGIAKGADYYIQKPFDIAYLESIVANLISQREKLKKRFSLDKPLVKNEKITTEASEFIERVNYLIQDNIADVEFSTDILSKVMNISRSKLFRKFRSLMDMSPGDYIRTCRLKKSASLLLETNHTVNEIALMVGFINTSHFIAAFRRFFGETPKEYIRSRKEMID
jgi:ligand-binding sensor domain-containing protein/signal transduction histidine kinase/DNA-binding response OmpR family regulator